MIIFLALFALTGFFLMFVAAYASEQNYRGR